MAIEREYGKYIPVCDNCLSTLEECDTFQDALDACKEAGWRNIKINGAWQNRCHNCQRGSKNTTPKFLDW